MVIFDILEVSNDGKTLILEAHVNKTKYFEGYKITDVYINDENNFLESGVNLEELLYHKKYEDKPTEIKEVIQGRFENKLLFVYVRIEPKANPCTEYLPCSLDGIDTLGVTFDTNLVYNKSLNYVKELKENCSISQKFVDFVLHWEAFKIFVKTEHYIDAVVIFNKYLKDKKIIKHSTCNCNGNVFI